MFDFQRLLALLKPAQRRRRLAARRNRRAFFEPLEGRSLLASVATLVEDGVPGEGINARGAGSNPRDYIDVNGVVYFIANDGFNGTELWRRTIAGATELVEDSILGGGIRPGAAGSEPGSLTNIGGTLYFTADDGTSGDELWRINGAGIAEIVEKSAVLSGGINAGSDSSYPDYLTNVGGVLYFAAVDGASGNELWRVNGAGFAELIETSAVPDGGIRPGSGSSNPDRLTEVSGTLYFTANDGTRGVELWRIDATVPGSFAQFVTDIDSDSLSGSYPRDLLGIGSTLYFTAHDGTGRELWSVDDSVIGSDALLVENIAASGGSYPDNLTNVAGTLYFTANDGIYGEELWRLDNGDAELVADIRPTNLGSYPYSLTDVGGTLFFVANDGANGEELWRIDAAGNAELVEDSLPTGGIASGSASPYVTELTAVGGTLYFRADDGVNGRELWQATATGLAQLVEDSIPLGGINSGSASSYPYALTNVGGTLFFSATDGVNGDELWRINAGVAELVEDILPGAESSYPQNLTNVGGTLYFNADNRVSGYELWRLNGNDAELVEGSVPGEGINAGNRASYPYLLTNVNGIVYFRADDGINGQELWRRDGSGPAEMVEDGIPGGGINPGRSSSRPHLLTNIDGTLYFSADDGENGYELWRINNVTGQAEMVDDNTAGVGISSLQYPAFGSFSNVNGTLYFRADDGVNGNELWRINATGKAELVVSAGIAPGIDSSYPSYLTKAGGVHYFTAFGPNGRELWRLDAAGVATEVADIRNGGIGSYPDNLSNVGGTLYFSANDGSNGNELWRINGAGNPELVDIGSGGSAPAYITEVGGVVYFSAIDGSYGRELWRISNGVPEMVADISLDSGSSNPNTLTDFGGTLYFTAFDPDNGRELWRLNADGNAELVEDGVEGDGIRPDGSGANPGLLTESAGVLYFFANDGTNGQELWRINGAGVAELVEDSDPDGGIAPGGNSSYPYHLVDVSGNLFFVARNADNGTELWRVNGFGMAELVEDSVAGGGIRPGAAGSYPSYPVNVNGTLYFGANDGFDGYELWAVDPNDRPTIDPNQVLSVAENSAAATVVGVVLAADLDAGQTLSYAITGGNTGNAFAIDANGQITVVTPGALNFEAQPQFSLTITVTDNGDPALSAAETVVVNLTNVNEAPTVTAGQTFSIAENSNNGSPVGTVLATDPDADQTAMLTYAITGGNTGGAFSINPATGAITVANGALLNFEGQSSFMLTVTATDAGTPVLNGSATVAVNVTNVNEAPIVAAGQSFSVAENSPNGTPVGTVAASDPDADQTTMLTYAITGGNTGGAFAINPATGAITVANGALLNFEGPNTFTLTVTATDNAATPLSGSATVTVNITDLNDAPTIGNQAFSVAENSAGGTAVGTVVAADPDAGQTLTYAITAGNTGGAFTINPTSGAISVASGAVLNFEGQNAFALTVTVTDSFATPLSSSATVTVNLTDVNDPPSIGPQSFSVPENSANGTAVGTVAASDPDAGQTLTYAITAGNAAGAFAINPSTGAITVANGALLNFEGQSSFDLTVTVTDNADPSLSSSATVTVNLSNVNEAPTIAPQSFSINENAPNGAAVALIFAQDPDAGQSPLFSIIGGSGQTAFAINNAGQLRVADSSQLDFETNPSLSVVVQVTDSANANLTNSATITVNLNDLAIEGPIMEDQEFTINRLARNGAIVGQVVAQAPAGQELRFSLAGNGAFAIDPVTGVIRVANAARLPRLGFRQTSASVVIQVTAAVAGSPDVATTADITITVRNNAAMTPNVADRTFSISENNRSGALVGVVIPTASYAGQRFRYSLAGPDAENFRINSSGRITVARGVKLDFEEQSRFDFQVVVADSRDASVFTEADITVLVRNVNEPPKVQLLDADELPVSFLSVEENTPVGTVVGRLDISDPDGTPSGSIGVTFIDPLRAFGYRRDTGEIFVADSSRLDFERLRGRRLQLTAVITDFGFPPSVRVFRFQARITNVIGA